MKALAHQGCSGFVADGIVCEILLEFVIRVVRDIADPAPVNDGGFLLFC